MQVNLLPPFDGATDFPVKKNATICTEFQESTSCDQILVESSQFRQEDFKLEQVRAPGILERVQGTLKSLGCLAQHKRRWRRAVDAAYRYLRADARIRQRAWRVLDVNMRTGSPGTRLGSKVMKSPARHYCRLLLKHLTKRSGGGKELTRSGRVLSHFQKKILNRLGAMS